MKRYIVKSDKQWKLVNADYKRSIRNFSTQNEAIEFAKKLLGTTEIVVQGKDNKFVRHIGVEHKTKEDVEMNTVDIQAIPIYVLNHATEFKEFTDNYLAPQFIVLPIVTMAAGITMFFLWLGERGVF